MKKILFVLFLLAGSSQVFAQKFGYIDIEYIINKMPDYKTANESMNQYADKWVKDIKLKYNDLDKLKEKFQQEEILLTADMKRERLAEIQRKEEEVKELNNNVFGMNGLIFQKKKEIIKPIMDEIYKSCEKIARQKKLMFIFDKASDMNMIYADPRHDYTDYIIEDLGIGTSKK